MRFEVETNLYNPSALAKKFSSIQTNFDVTLGKISAILSDSEIEEYLDGHTTMNSRLSSVVQDMEGVHTQISSMQTDYEEGFQSVDSRLTTVDETIGGIRAEVSSVHSEYNGLNTRVSSAETKITDSAIVSTVRSSDSYKGDLASKNATFTGDYIPTTSNAPASTWTTTALKESHLNDTFLTSGGELYQYISGHNGLMITFSSDSRTETKWDYVRIYYQRDNKTYVLPDISGKDISGASVFVPSNEFWLYWRSDKTQVYYGFRIASIEWVFSNTPTLTEATLPEIEPTPMSGTNYPETTHPYTNNEEKFWKYTNSSHSASVNPSYGWARREDGGIRTLTERMSAAELKITDSAIVSTVTSSQFGQTVTSTIKQTSDGIHLDAKYVSWSSTYSSMTKDGKLTCTGGEIGGFTIGSSAIYNGISSVDATLGTGVYVGTDGINLGGGKFKVTPAGAMTATSADISGKVTSSSGRIGGFTIDSTALYNGISSPSASSGSGVYLGIYGINLGGGKFKVTPAGALTSTSGTIGGWTIDSTQLSNGYANISPNHVFIKNASNNFYVTGIRPGEFVLFGTYESGFATKLAIESEDNYKRMKLRALTAIHTWLQTYGTGIRFDHTGANAAYSYLYPYTTTSDISFRLGSGMWRWDYIYSLHALNVSSDLKHKSVIKEHDWKIDEFISGLEPIAFYRIHPDGEKGKRIHMGFGAQSVSQLSKNLDIGDLALYDARIVSSDKEDGVNDEDYHGEEIDDENLEWGIQYTELIAPIVLELQRLMKRVDVLENGKGATI